MGPKKPPKTSSDDLVAEKQFREEEIARTLFEREEQTQLSRAKKTLIMRKPHCIA